jgi:serine/threonine protein kinase
VWSIGVMFYQLITGEVPYISDSMDDLREKVMSGFYYLNISQNNLSFEGVSLISKCL